MIRSATWTPQPLPDIIPCDSTLFQEELDKKIYIKPNIRVDIRHYCLNIIYDNWDSFCKVGATPPLFDSNSVLLVDMSQWYSEP